MFHMHMHGGRHGHHRHHGFGPRGGRGGGGDPFGMEGGFGSPDGGHDVRGGGRGGRARRMFDGAELRLVMLKLIGDAPRHGYELIRAVEELTGGAYAPSPGVVYPTLTLLEEMGLTAEQRTDDAKKRYAATDEGRSHLEERHEEVTALFAKLEHLGSRQEQHAGSPVWRAMRNLGMAVRQRQMRGELSEEAMHDAAALIDEVAQKIERLK